MNERDIRTTPIGRSGSGRWRLAIAVLALRSFGTPSTPARQMQLGVKVVW